VLVVSTKIAISEAFYACWIYSHGTNPGILRTNPLDDGTFADTIAEDNMLMARALADAGHVAMPSNLPFNDANATAEVFEAEVSSVLLPIVPGSTEYSLWHMITGAPAVEEDSFTNTETGEKFDAWNTDTVEITDSNGWTAKFQFTPGAPYNWMLVPNSVRDKSGNPVNTIGSAPVPGGTAEPVGALDVSLPSSWGTAEIYITPWYDDSLPDGQITVGPILQCYLDVATGECY
jgi:hypothetical protein